MLRKNCRSAPRGPPSMIPVMPRLAAPCSIRWMRRRSRPSPRYGGCTATLRRVEGDQDRAPLPRRIPGVLAQQVVDGAADDRGAERGEHAVSLDRLAQPGDAGRCPGGRAIFGDTEPGQPGPYPAAHPGCLIGAERAA